MEYKINNKIVRLTDRAGNPVQESDFLPIEVLSEWTRKVFERYDKIKKNDLEQHNGKYNQKTDRHPV